MSVAHFVDLEQRSRGGSFQPGGWREGVTYRNALLREAGPRISYHIWGSSVHAKTISPRMRLTQKDLWNSDKKWQNLRKNDKIKIGEHHYVNPRFFLGSCSLIKKTSILHKRTKFLFLAKFEEYFNCKIRIKNELLSLIEDDIE